jgi:aminodeoxyfutalosine deaminase
MLDLLALPKVELHVHLDGLFKPATVLKLAERHQAINLLPGFRESDITSWFVFRDFSHFADIKRTLKKLLRTADDFALVVYEAGRTLSSQNVRYAEITLTPYSLIDTLDYGLTISMLLDGLKGGREQVYADFGIELRWVFDIPRNRAFADYRNGGAYVAEAAERTLEYALLGQPQGVVALGLGGNEVNALPEPFTEVFAEAKRQGLRSAPHAGESEGPPSVWGTIDALQADRVGHGVRAIEDHKLLKTLAARQIPLEVNISSNIALGFYARLEDHPIRALYDAGLRLTVNTDDPEMVGTTLVREYTLLRDVFGFSDTEVVGLARNGFLSMFAEPHLKARLLTEFDQWVEESV